MHLLDARDKHRLLIPVIHYSAIGDIYVEDQYGGTYRGDTWATVQVPWGAAAIPYHVSLERGLHVKDPGGASFDVMFQEGDSGTEARAADTLRIYSRFILEIVELFESFVE